MLGEVAVIVSRSADVLKLRLRGTTVAVLDISSAGHALVGNAEVSSGVVHDGKELSVGSAQDTLIWLLLSPTQGIRGLV